MSGAQNLVLVPPLLLERGAADLLLIILWETLGVHR
jgi:hypothetical protein